MRRTCSSQTLSVCAITLLVASTLFIACKRKNKSDLLTNNTDPNKTALDVNDLSYMFVKNKTGQIYPRIQVAKTWNQIRQQHNLPAIDENGVLAKNQVLNPGVHDNIVRALADQTNFAGTKLKTPFVKTNHTGFKRQDFVVTAFRIDPCAPSLALDKNRTNYQNDLSQSVIKGIVQQINREITKIFKGKPPFQIEKCQTQLRLILQPAEGGGKNIKESTIHMVYTLNNSAGVMSNVMQADVQGLKQALQQATGVDTTGFLLQPHPGLKAEASNNSDAARPGAAAQAVVAYLSSMLRHYANPQVVAVIRERVFNGIQYNAVLGGGVVDPREGARYSTAPLVGSNARKGFIVRSSADRSNWEMDPKPMRNDPIFNHLKSFDASDVTTSEDYILRKMMTMDDPESTHFFLNDCVTCHGTSQALRELKNPLLAAKVATRFRVPAGVSGFPIGNYLPAAPSKSGGFMMRNFGYSRGKPVIGLRTVTETAQLVDYFNRDLRGVNNPGANCAGESEQKAWALTFSMGQQTAPYKFDAKSPMEDAVFEKAKCKTAITGREAIGRRGDSSNPAKLGQVASPIFSQMSFTGEDAKGNVLTLVLTNQAKALLATLRPGSKSPELLIGQWSYVTDAQRTTQVRVTINGGTKLYVSRGISLCEVGVQKGSLCLSLQADWVGDRQINDMAQAGQPVSRSTSLKNSPITQSDFRRLLGLLRAKPENDILNTKIVFQITGPCKDNVSAYISLQGGDEKRTTLVTCKINKTDMIAVPMDGTTAFGVIDDLVEFSNGSTFSGKIIGVGDPIDAHVKRAIFVTDINAVPAGRIEGTSN